MIFPLVHNSVFNFHYTSLSRYYLPLPVGKLMTERLAAHPNLLQALVCVLLYGTMW